MYFLKYKNNIIIVYNSIQFCNILHKITFLHNSIFFIKFNNKTHSSIVINSIITRINCINNIKKNNYSSKQNYLKLFINLIN